MSRSFRANFIDVLHWTAVESLLSTINDVIRSKLFADCWKVELGRVVA